MGYLQLRFDRRRLAFLAWVAFRVLPAPWFTLELAVDSGSNATGIGSQVAQAFGIPLPTLARGELAVVGGLTRQSFLRAVPAALFGDAPPEIRLRRLWILEPIEPGPGGTVQAGVLGLDARPAYGASVVLNLHKGEGWTEW